MEHLAEWKVKSAKDSAKEVVVLPLAESDQRALSEMQTYRMQAEPQIAVKLSKMASTIASLDYNGVVTVAKKILAVMPRRRKGKERFKTSVQQAKLTAKEGRRKRKRKLAPLKPVPHLSLTTKGEGATRHPRACGMTPTDKWMLPMAAHLGLKRTKGIPLSPPCPHPRRW